LRILIEEGDGKLAVNACQALKEQGNAADIAHVSRKRWLPKPTGSMFTVILPRVDRDFPEVQKGNTNV
jgi:hypothetical protein